MRSFQDIGQAPQNSICQPDDESSLAQTASTSLNSVQHANGGCLDECCNAGSKIIVEARPPSDVRRWSQSSVIDFVVVRTKMMLLRRCLATHITQRSMPRCEHSSTYAPIYVAATRQHVGKTSVSLALMSGLQKRFDRVGFIKPVGQHSVPKTINGQEIHVDKDAALMKDHFQLSHISYPDSSPVLIPKGYTRQYLDGIITNEHQIQQLQSAFQRISNASDIVLCEGTGHVAVGSIIDQNNAECAKLLQANMILVANGGLGHCFDELELNRTLCETLDVNIAGVILNKVRPDKYDQTQKYFTKALQQKWKDIPLLGCIPDRPFLGSPALADLERLIQAEFISGGIHRLRHFRPNDCRLVATSLEVFLRMVQQLELVEPNITNERKLFVCHASRNDILLGYIMMMESMARRATEKMKSNTIDEDNEENVPVFRSAMLITGTFVAILLEESTLTLHGRYDTGTDDHPLSDHVLDICRRSSSPVLVTTASTDDAMNALYGYTPKLHINDGHRVDMTVEHYEPYIDFDRLMDRCRRT